MRVSGGMTEGRTGIRQIYVQCASMCGQHKGTSDKTRKTAVEVSKIHVYAVLTPSGGGTTTPPAGAPQQLPVDQRAGQTQPPPQVDGGIQSITQPSG